MTNIDKHYLWIRMETRGLVYVGETQGRLNKGMCDHRSDKFAVFVRELIPLNFRKFIKILSNNII